MLNLLLQIPLVGIFVWYTLKQKKMESKERRLREESWQAERKLRDRSWQTTFTETIDKERSLEKERTEAMRVLGTLGRDARTDLMAGQDKLEVQNARIITVLIGILEHTGKKESADLMRQMLEDDQEPSDPGKPRSEDWNWRLYNRDKP